ncbi:MAG: YgiT-type zinc finger protein [Armatimonadota bacterium]|nr:YgiT-type zinc finger protein [Armatimonadota bacterium]
MITRCYGCGGKLELRYVTVKNWWGSRYTLVPNVRAYVCRECGEHYYDAKTCLHLDRLRRSTLMGPETQRGAAHVPPPSRRP